MTAIPFLETAPTRGAPAEAALVASPQDKGAVVPDQPADGFATYMADPPAQDGVAFAEPGPQVLSATPETTLEQVSAGAGSPASDEPVLGDMPDLAGADVPDLTLSADKTGRDGGQTAILPVNAAPSEDMTVAQTPAHGNDRPPPIPPMTEALFGMQTAMPPGVSPDAVAPTPIQVRVDDMAQTPALPVQIADAAPDPKVATQVAMAKAAPNTTGRPDLPHVDLAGNQTQISGFAAPKDADAGSSVPLPTPVQQTGPAVAQTTAPQPANTAMPPLFEALKNGAVLEKGGGPVGDDFALLTGQGDRTSGPGTVASQTAPTPAGQARAVAAQMSVAVTQMPGNATEIALNPEELGRVRLSLTAIDGAVTLTISAERPDTQDLLRRHIDVLEREFRDIGYGSVGFEFNDQGQPAKDDAAAGHPAPDGTAEDAEPTDPATPTQYWVTGGMDIRL